MEKIYFDETTFVWKTKINFSQFKEQLLSESYRVIDEAINSKFDAYGYKSSVYNLDFIGDITISNKLDEIYQLSIDICKELWNESNSKGFNIINTDSWVNVVKSNNPSQINFKHNDIKMVNKYHTHTELNKANDRFIPHYTYVYYIQMPDVMEGEDGVLYFKGNNDKEYWIRPEEDDLIIMPADMPHAPNSAPNATIDRIVLAGNIGFDLIKKQKSLI